MILGAAAMTSEQVSVVPTSRVFETADGRMEKPESVPRIAEVDHLTTKRRSQDLARQAIPEPDIHDRPKPLGPRPQLHGPPLC
jgi:7,8-dihydro-6-hydroxymethylpterin-pyrophosphokinase